MLVYHDDSDIISLLRETQERRLNLGDLRVCANRAQGRQQVSRDEPRRECTLLAFGFGPTFFHDFVVAALSSALPQASEQESGRGILHTT